MALPRSMLTKKEQRMLQIKELDDILRFIQDPDVRKDLVYTRDQLLKSLEEEL